MPVPLFRKLRRRPRGRLFPARYSGSSRGYLHLFTAVMLILAAALPASLYLRSLMSQYGVANTRDAIIINVNDVINRKMSEGDYGYDYFINLEKDAAGNITALTSDITHINLLCSELIRDIVSSADMGEFDLSVPIGNLIGLSLFSGRGPKIPIKVVMLTSSSADLRNDFSSAGINQTKHQIVMEINIDLSILIPWDTILTTVKTEVLVAETVIVGKVPDTYLNWGAGE